MGNHINVESKPDFYTITVKPLNQPENNTSDTKQLMNRSSLLKAKQQIITCLGNNQVSKAKQIGKKLCASFPKDPECWSLLGSVEDRLSNTCQACTAYKKAIHLKPDYFEALYNLGCIQLNSGKASEAFQLFSRALQIRPDSPEANNNLGILHKNQGDTENAIKHFQQAIRKDPDNAMTWFNLGNTQVIQENHEEAISCFRKAVSIHPEFTDAYYAMGNVCRQLFMRTEAMLCFKQVIRFQPEHIDGRLSLADILVLLGRHDEALNYINDAIENGNTNISLISSKATILEKSGNLQQAYELITTYADTKSPDTGLALTFSNLCQRFDCCATALDWLNVLLDSSENTTDETASIHQAKGKILDRQKKYHDAFFHYHEANRLKQSLGEKSLHNQDIEKLLGFYQTHDTQNLPASRVKTELPVFIIGMPRSGTSLVEQIIASHPDAHGAGELPHINRFVSSLPARMKTEKGYPECLLEIKTSLLDTLATEYLKYTQGVAPNARRIVDKLPHNFMWLGLISLLFPGAKIIHCIRDPMDNCLSLYTTRGFNAHHSYAFDLEQLGLHYRKYQELIAMWKEKLQLPIYDIQYENLITDFENQTRALIEFCGLEWDNRCLRYYESGRISSTLSYDQVRKPVYNSSIGRWENYRDFLKPLQQSLDQNN